MNNRNNYNSYYFINDNNPYSSRSDDYLEKELNILYEKVKRNKEQLNLVNLEQKIILENQISEDQIRINSILDEFKRRNYCRMVIIFVSFFIILFMILFMIWLYNMNYINVKS